MLSFTSEDYAINIVTLKGTRNILIPQFRTDTERAADLSEYEQLLVMAGVLKPPVDLFPYAIVQTSRMTPRDPRDVDRTIEVRPGDRLALLPPYRYKNSGELETYIWCPQCGDWQLPDAFYNDATRPNGKRGWCKSCENLKRVERRRIARLAAAA